MFDYNNPAILVYLILLSLAWGVYLRRKSAIEKRNYRIRKELVEAGCDEPPTLHPVINHNRCLGCGSCVNACPEEGALGIIGGKCYLVEPSNCIGHGVCKLACPQDAITLVLGSPTRGVEIPIVDENFESNVPGVFIAGELTGIGLIHNAVNQGRKAVENIYRKYGAKKGGDVFDVLIVGAGPAGFAASLEARSRGMNYITIEQESLGGTVAHFPKNKLVMTAPVELPGAGLLKIREIKKEELLEIWKNVEEKSAVRINYGERVLNVEREGESFKVTTTKSTYRTRTVLLALGVRGTPRKLGVPGEELSKVVYALSDAEEYRGKSVLVVGGGDSALEAATSLAEFDDIQVTLSYRSKVFARAKRKNREKLDRMERAGRLRVLRCSHVKRIGEDFVELEVEGQIVHFENDAVIICAGGVPPAGFLKDIGIALETKYGTP